MSKKNKKFTIEEKERYHKNRVQSSKTTPDQKAYSRNWLDGLHDERASGNLPATKHELENRKKKVTEMERQVNLKKISIKNEKLINKNVFGGYINGATARLKNKKSG